MDVRQYVGKTLIGWVYYNENYTHGDYANFINRVCYVYPRFVCGEDGCATPVDPADFPQLGSIEVRIQGGYSAEEVVDALSNLVLIKLNVIPEEDRSQQNNIYRMKFHPQFREEASEIWLERFQLPDYIQVVHLPQSFEAFQANPVILSSEPLFTPVVAVQNKEGFFGPFQYERTGEHIRFTALPERDYRVVKADPFEVNKHLYKVAHRGEGETVLTRAEGFAEDAPNKGIVDFIADGELLQHLFRLFEASRALSKVDFEDFKRMMMERLHRSDTPAFEKHRLERMVQFLRKTEDAQGILSHVAHFLMDDPKQRDYVLRQIIDHHFEELEERAGFFVEVRERLGDLEREKASLEAVLETLRARKDEGEALLREEHRDLAEALLDERSQLTGEVEALEAEIASARAELGDLHRLSSLDAACREATEELHRLQETRDSLLDSLREATEEFRDRGKLIGWALREEGFQEVLATAKGLRNPKPHVFAAEETLAFTDFSEVVDYVHYAMNDRFDFRISKDMVVNLLLQLVYAPLVNITGPTGSGKTSMAVYFAASIGRTEDNGGFLRIQIDPDIRSVRDLVGYFNPVTGELVRNHLRLFEMIERAQAHPELPFILLLDNADVATPEHYLGALLEREPGEDAVLNLGGGFELVVPENVRIWTTLAGDHTAVELSRRFFDKSVTLRAGEWRTGYRPAHKKAFDRKGALDYPSICALASKHAELPMEFENKLMHFADLMRRRGLVLSERALQNARRFTAASRHFMESYAGMQKFYAVEMAVLQYFLAGRTGVDLGAHTLELLSSETENMPVLHKAVEDLAAEVYRFSMGRGPLR